MTLSCSNINDTSGVCATLEGTGTGLGVFVQALAQALPAFLIILGIVGVIIAIGYAIAGVISRSIGQTHRR